MVSFALWVVAGIGGMAGIDTANARRAPVFNEMACSHVNHQEQIASFQVFHALACRN